MTRDELRNKYEDETILTPEQMKDIHEAIKAKGQLTSDQADRLYDSLTFLRQELSLQVYSCEMLKQDYAMLRTRLALALKDEEKDPEFAQQLYAKEALEIDLSIQTRLKSLYSNAGQTPKINSEEFDDRQDGTTIGGPNVSEESENGENPQTQGGISQAEEAPREGEGEQSTDTIPQQENTNSNSN